MSWGMAALGVGLVLVGLYLVLSSDFQGTRIAASVCMPIGGVILGRARRRTGRRRRSTHPRA